MGKNPSEVSFEQPMHEKGGESSKKNKSEVGYDQGPRKKAGKNSTKVKSEAGFAQTPRKGQAKAQTAGEAPFEQPDHGGSAPMPKAQDKQGVVQKKMTKERRPQPQVGPKFTSVDALMKFRKKKYGV